MQWVLTIIYLTFCILLIAVVLLQRGKESSGDLFGAGASSVLSGQGATSFLVKLTATLSAGFFFLSFFLGMVINQSVNHVRVGEMLKANAEISAEQIGSVDSAATVEAQKLES